MSRPRHTDKDIESFLQELEKDGWRVEKGNRYFRIFCPCRERTHQRSVALTPSNPQYLRNARAWVNRTIGQHDS